MATLPGLNHRHKAGLVLVLAAAGASLLLDASAKQTTGVVLLGLAVTWFVASMAVRTLGIVVSAITFLVRLCVAVLPIWNERESVLAAEREYDATVAEIQRAAANMEMWEDYAKTLPTSPRAVEESHKAPLGARLGEPIQYRGTVDIPAKWLRSPSPEEAIAAKHGGSVAVVLGEVSEQ